jgi:hypothetical protein
LLASALSWSPGLSFQPVFSYCSPTGPSSAITLANSYWKDSGLIFGMRDGLVFGMCCEY